MRMKLHARMSQNPNVLFWQLCWFVCSMLPIWQRLGSLGVVLNRKIHAAQWTYWHRSQNLWNATADMLADLCAWGWKVLYRECNIEVVWSGSKRLRNLVLQSHAVEQFNPIKTSTMSTHGTIYLSVFQKVKTVSESAFTWYKAACLTSVLNSWMSLCLFHSDMRSLPTFWGHLLQNLHHVTASVLVKLSCCSSNCRRNNHTSTRDLT